MAKRGASDDDGKVMIANVADGLRRSHGILLGETFSPNYAEHKAWQIHP
jgi:hypothetical protein